MSEATTLTPVVFKGKEYKVSPLDIDMLCMFAKWLEDRAFEAIQIRKSDLDEADYNRLLSLWLEQCVSGRFRWGSRAATAAGQSRDGMKFLAFLQLSKLNKGMSQKLASQIFDAE